MTLYKGLQNILIVCALLAGILIHSPLVNAESKLSVRLLSDPTGFDWNGASTTMETYVLLNIMEGLVEFDEAMHVRPGLAEHWSISKDHKTYTFYLRKGALWSDGTAVTAQQFLDSWQRLLSPETAAPYAYFLFDIVGAEEFHNKKITNFSQVGIKALDAHTFQVTLKYPVSYFIYIPTYWVTFPIRKDLLEKYGRKWTEPANLAVTGPFVLHSYQPQYQVVLKKNSRYHGKAPALDTVVMRIVNENNTALNLYRSRQLDVVSDLTTVELGDMMKSPEFHVVPYYRVNFLAFNTTKPPFDSAQVRQAVAQAIDRSQIPKLFKGIKTAAFSLVPSVLIPDQKEVTLPFDPHAAKKLLEKAKVQASNLQGLTLIADANDETAQVVQFVQQELQKNLGLAMQVKIFDFKTFMTKQNLLDGSVFLRRWGADYPDPDSFVQILLSDSGNNRTGWKNSEYDTFVMQARKEHMLHKRQKIYHKALSLLLKKEAPVVPLYFDAKIYLLNPRVKNFKIDALNCMFLKNVTLSP